MTVECVEEVLKVLEKEIEACRQRPHRSHKQTKVGVARESLRQNSCATVSYFTVASRATPRHIQFAEGRLLGTRRRTEATEGVEAWSVDCCVHLPQVVFALLYFLISHPTK